MLYERWRKSTPCGGPPPARTTTPAGQPAEGMIWLRNRLTKCCEGSSPYSCLPATITCA